MEKNISVQYKPIIQSDKKIDGIAGETIPDGKKGKIIQKAFIMSLEDNFETYTNNITNMFVGNSIRSSLNNLLIIIDNDNQAKIYHHFPITVKARLKKGKKINEAILEDELIDIVEIFFQDELATIDIKDGDKVIWLFRHNWKFGLYFDFTHELRAANLHKELASCYKKILYLDMFSFLEKDKNINDMLSDGWFPFIQLIGPNFNNLMNHYNDDKKYSIHINKILEFYTKERINEICTNWWNNPILLEKKEILEAGIEAYFQNTNSGYINSIKTLSTEIEGIIRLAYFRKYNKQPNTKELKQFVKQSGEKIFSEVDSFGFPSLFYNYLENSIFEPFNLAEGQIPSSRHSFAHGIAEINNYNKIRAFQLILTIDQIYFFLNT